MASRAFLPLTPFFLVFFDVFRSGDSLCLERVTTLVTGKGADMGPRLGAMVKGIQGLFTGWAFNSHFVSSFVVVGSDG